MNEDFVSDKIFCQASQVMSTLAENCRQELNNVQNQKFIPDNILLENKSMKGWRNSYAITWVKCQLTVSWLTAAAETRLDRLLWGETDRSWRTEGRDVIKHDNQLPNDWISFGNKEILVRFSFLSPFRMIIIVSLAYTLRNFPMKSKTGSDICPNELHFSSFGGGIYHSTSHAPTPTPTPQQFCPRGCWRGQFYRDVGSLVLEGLNNFQLMTERSGKTELSGRVPISHDSFLLKEVQESGEKEQRECITCAEIISMIRLASDMIYN